MEPPGNRIPLPDHFPSDSGSDDEDKKEVVESVVEADADAKLVPPGDNARTQETNDSTRGLRQTSEEEAFVVDPGAASNAHRLSANRRQDAKMRKSGNVPATAPGAFDDTNNNFRGLGVNSQKMRAKARNRNGAAIESAGRDGEDSGGKMRKSGAAAMATGAVDTVDTNNVRGLGVKSREIRAKTEARAGSISDAAAGGADADVEVTPNSEEGDPSALESSGSPVAGGDLTAGRGEPGLVLPVPIDNNLALGNNHSVEEEYVATNATREGLVEARAINETSSLHVVSGNATEVDPNVIQRQAQKERKERECQAIGLACICLACVVLAISLGVGLTRKDGDQQAIIVDPVSINNTTDQDTFPPLSNATTALAPASLILDQLVSEELPNYTREALMDPNSPQSKAYEWIKVHPELPYMSTSRQINLFALVTFFYSFEGPNWPSTIQNDWLLYDRHECAWFSSVYGNFEADGRYTYWPSQQNYTICFLNERNETEFQALGLSDLNLTQYNPVIPREIELLSSLAIISLANNGIQEPVDQILTTEIYQLPHLQFLWLSNNLVYGQFPSEIGLLTQLATLSLDGTSLTGSIPTELWQLTDLTFLGLQGDLASQSIGSGIAQLAKLTSFWAYNMIGNVPTELNLLTQLESLYLNSYGQLLSATALDFYSFTNLKQLAMNGVEISSNLADIGRLTSLEFLSLEGCSIWGTIPTTIGLLNNLGIFLNLASNALTGSIPTELGALTSIAFLNLADNALIGSIPTELGALTFIENLSLGYNQLTGSVPPQLFHWKNLLTLILGANMLTGALPSELGQWTALKFLDLGANLLTGALSPEIFSLTRLSSLFLGENSFAGRLPSSLGLLSKLDHFKLSSNLFSGSLPMEIYALTSLRFFLVDQNSFSGQVPTGIYQLSALSDLNLQFNAFSGQLPIPTEVNVYPLLNLLMLASNSFSGPIPSSVGLLSRVDALGLGDNLLEGQIPTEIGSLTQLTYLDLEKNRALGSLPTQLGNLKDLLQLWVEGSSLTGTLPTEISGMSALQLLHLYGNQLSGSLPTSLGLLTNLQLIVIPQNQLSGPIITELGLLPGLFLLSLSRNALTSTLPTELGEWSSLQILSFEHNPLASGSIPSQIGLLTDLSDLYLANCSLTGTVPYQVARLASANNLRLLNVSLNPSVEGQLQDDLCQLNDQSCRYSNPVATANNCSMVFDCLANDNGLCGCDCGCNTGTNQRRNIFAHP